MQARTKLLLNGEYKLPQTGRLTLLSQEVYSTVNDLTNPEFYSKRGIHGLDNAIMVLAIAQAELIKKGAIL